MGIFNHFLAFTSFVFECEQVQQGTVREELHLVSVHTCASGGAL